MQNAEPSGMTKHLNIDIQVYLKYQPFSTK